MAKINVDEAFRAFYDTLETNPLRPSEILLWQALLSVVQKAGYWGGFAIASSLLESKTDLKRDTLDKARNALQQAGLIQWKKSGGRGNPTYELIRFWEHDEPADYAPTFDAENITVKPRTKRGQGADKPSANSGQSAIESEDCLMPKKTPLNREQSADKPRTNGGQQSEQNAIDFDAEKITVKPRTKQGETPPCSAMPSTTRMHASALPRNSNTPLDNNILNNNIVVVDPAVNVDANFTGGTGERTTTMAMDDPDDLFDIPMAERIKRSDELTACLNVARGIHLDPNNSVHIEEVDRLIGEYPAAWVLIAIRRAVNAGKEKQNLSYTRGILRRFKANGGPDPSTRDTLETSAANYDPNEPYADWAAIAKSREDIG